MQLLRMFSTEKYKGIKGYLNSQKKYEVIRTVLYFGISLCLFIAGWVTTKTRLNLLTIVAVLGCLPASKSLVGMIMFMRFHSCPEAVSEEIEEHVGELYGMYDLVFTSYDKNYQVDHVVVKGNTVCGFAGGGKFDEQGFYKHIDGILKADNYKDVSVKVFGDIRKYVDRLEQMKELDANEESTEGIAGTLRSVAL